MKCLTELGVGSNAKEAQSLSKDENKLWNLGLHHRVLLDIATTFSSKSKRAAPKLEIQPVHFGASK